MRTWGFSVALLGMVVLSGCPKTQHCMSVSATSDLLRSAQLVHFDVYPSGTVCVNGLLAVGAPAFVRSQSFKVNETLQLDIPAGTSTLVLTTFSDTAGQVPLGEGCVEVNLKADSQTCLAMTLLRALCSAGSPCPCDTNSDCADRAPVGTTPRPVCDLTQHSCFECAINDDCALGRVCKNGSCVAGCDQQAMRGCPSPYACCATTCTLTRDDPQNCGGCGLPCNGSQVCSRGGCTTACSDNATACGSACHDVSSNPNACGGCGQTCTGSQVCSNGGCHDGCDVGLTDCNGWCLDTTGSAYGCGSCDTVCAPAQTCQQGQCNCPTGLSLCDGKCVDLTSDSANCNACSVVCASPSFCVSGQCTTNCPSGEVCNFGHANQYCYQKQTANDPAHCIDCVTPCDSNHPSVNAICSSGVCGYPCVTGHLSCDTVLHTTGSDTNGCETDIFNDVMNCGDCNNACAAVHNGVPKCNGGQCELDHCTGTFATCGGTSCNINLSTSDANCGVCFHPCPSTESCINGQCIVTGSGTGSGTSEP